MYSTQETKGNHSLYIRYGPRLLKFAEKFVPSYVAEDILHDVFLRLWAKHVFVLPEEDISRLLFASVRNACIDHIRKIQNEQDALSNRSLQLKLEELDYYDSSEEQFMNRDLLDLLMKEVDSLPEKTRLVFKMVYVEGLKASEIADQLDVSVRTVENQIYRALTHLRKKFKYTLLAFLIIS